METITHGSGENRVTEIIADSLLIRTPGDFLDLTANLGCSTFILKKEHLNDGFFDLRTGFAGEVMQKTSNYGLRMGIVGDFTGLQSRSLRDFIRECNRGRRILFKESVEEILEIFGRNN